MPRRRTLTGRKERDKNRLYMKARTCSKREKEADLNLLTLKKGPNFNCRTLDTSRTQFKVDRNDEETVSANTLLVEVMPLDRTSESVEGVTSGAKWTEVKLEVEDDPLRQNYCNLYEDSMEIEHYTFTKSTPNDLTSTSDATEVTVKLELEPEDDN